MIYYIILYRSFILLTTNEPKVNNRVIYMSELDELLSIIENPTRRRILEYLTREPSYPLQLSKDLGISQQAVMKNLALMEQTGVLVSHPQESNIGPTRNVYSPNQQFTIVIDLHDNMFTARIVSSDIGNSDRVEMDGIDDAVERIGELDSRIEQLDAERSELLNERNAIMSWLNRVTRDMDPQTRHDVYERLELKTKEDEEKEV